ncbi:hypothetical protein Y1Q_0010882 [Alligator mississippiensis]|uniref:Uncharacterized protein n=1 Tax=Alligator mississippiensis TaxID=8496 RepID=A0A151M751_ALLMI|nr:hypothetical protein Y1Q_0010882 [Alligator mississippiensis]
MPLLPNYTLAGILSSPDPYLVFSPGSEEGAGLGNCRVETRLAPRGERRSAMAPRLRLNITKPLPTICETHEELQEDLSSNARSLGSLSTNSDLCSSEDYLQSICQLARPTFPAIPENHPRVRDKTTLQEDRRCPKPAVMPRAIPKCQLTNIISNIMSLEKVHLVCEEGKPYPCSGDDPLEKLYAQAGKTHHYKGPASSESLSADYSQSSPYNTSSDETHLVDSQDKPTKKPNLPRIFSFPRLPSPGPVQREDRFPELKSLKISERSASGSDQTQKENCTMLISVRLISTPAALMASSICDELPVVQMETYEQRSKEKSSARNTGTG